MNNASYDRRDFLKAVGKAGLALGAFGLTLERQTFLREAYGIEPQGALYDAALTVFMNGGPSQTDTFDPKPGSPNNVFDTISLGINDVYGQPVRVSNVFPTLADTVQNDAAVGLGLIRSMTHGNGAHESAQRYMNAFWEGPLASVYPSTAAVMSYLYQDASGGLGIPSVMVAGANGDGANDAKQSKVPTALRVNAGDGQNPVVRALRLPDGVDAARYTRRSALRTKLDQIFMGRRQDQVAQAFAKATTDATAITLKGDAPQAFDLTGVPLVPARDNGTRQRLTQAARLLEFGVPYVSCAIGGNDTHSNNTAAINGNWGQSIDQGLMEVVDRIKQTGKRVLILVGGEFGRTPQTVAPQADGTRRDGRDHWPDGFSWGVISVNQPLFTSTAVGDTGPDGTWRESQGNLVDPYHPRDLGAFFYRALGFNVGDDPRFHIPLTDRDAAPVDRVNKGDELLQTFGLRP
jgi:hypothetical protein